MNKPVLSLLLGLSFCLTSCGVQSKLSSTTPEMLPKKMTEWTISGIPFKNGDFSGLAFSADGKRMIAAFNSAALYWMDIPQEGKELHFDPFEVKGAKFHEEKRDIECVTVNKKTGDIYYGQERDGKFKGASIYKIDAPSYKKEDLVVTFKKDVIPDGNTGIEGLTWTGGDNFIVGREGQWDKRRNTHRIQPLMVFYSLSKGITEKIVPADEIKQIAEIVYDEVRDCLWILDGDYDKVLYRCSMKGEVIDRFPIPKIKNAEALLLDRKHKCIWIGSDEEPSKLYKIPFKNL